MLTGDDWEKCGGVVCSRCEGETVRLKEGLCPSCLARKRQEEARAMEYAAMALTYRALPKKKPSVGGAGQRSL